MKKSFSSLILAIVVSFGAVCAQAAEVTSEASVLKLRGAAQIQLPGQTSATALKVGDKVPQGSIVSTPSKSSLELLVHPGVKATLKPASTVEIEKLSVTSAAGTISKQTTILNLKSGTVVSDIDGSKKGLNNYSIRTPKGLATANGTVYTVTVTGSNVRIFVAQSTVTFIGTDGKSVIVQAGEMVEISPEGVIGTPQPISDEATQAIENKDNSVYEIDPSQVGTVVSPEV